MHSCTRVRGAQTRGRARSMQDSRLSHEPPPMPENVVALAVPPAYEDQDSPVVRLRCNKVYGAVTPCTCSRGSCPIGRRRCWHPSNRKGLAAMLCGSRHRHHSTARTENLTSTGTTTQHPATRPTQGRRGCVDSARVPMRSPTPANMPLATEGRKMNCSIAPRVGQTAIRRRSARAQIRRADAWKADIAPRSQEPDGVSASMAYRDALL